MGQKWEGPPFTFGTGRKPKNCYRDPKSPFWQYDFQIKGVRERGSTGCDDARGAESFVEARRTAIHAEVNAEAQSPVSRAGFGSTPAYREKPDILFSEAMATLIEDKGIEGHALRNPMYSSKHLLRLIGDKPVHELTHSDFFNYRQLRAKEKSRFGRPVAPTTINRDIAHARSTFTHIKAKGFRMPDEPPIWPKLFDAHAEKTHARVRELKPHEELDLFRTLFRKMPDLAAVVEFAMLCGQRRTAVITLKRSAIDWVNKQFTILLKTKGHTKRTHVVPLTARMIEIIEAQPEVEGVDEVFTYVCRHGRKAHKDRQGRVYDERVKGKRYPFSKEGWEKIWRDCVREAGLSDFKFHDLRHTAATRLIRAIRDPNIVKQLLGHENIQTTQRYVHANTDDVLEGLEAAQKRSEEQRRELENKRRRDNIRRVA